LERRSIEEAQKNEILVTSSGRAEINKVVTYVTNRNLSSAARAWLVGEQPEKADLERLGVTHPIDSFELGRAVLFVFFRLAERAGVQARLYLDQAEKFVFDSGALLPQNAGLIHSLAEFLPAESGLFVVASSDDAWKGLPTDLKQRFGSNQIFFPPLGLSTARRLLAVYLNNGEPLSDAQSEPFDESAVEMLLVTSGGNVRRFLQHCSLTYDLAVERSSGRIDDALVAEALKRSQITLPVRPTVVQEIKRIAAQLEIPLQEHRRFRGSVADLIIEEKGRAVRGVIQIVEPLFGDQLSSVALNGVRIAEEIRTRGLPAVVILVVIGYADPAAIEALNSLVTNVIVYTPDSFAKDLAEALLRMPRPDTLQRPAAFERELRAELERLRRELLQERALRNHHLAAANQEAAKVLEREQEETQRERWRAIKKEWLREQRELETQIVNRRKEKLDEDIKALEWERRKAEEALSFKRKILAACCSLYTLIGAIPGANVFLRHSSLYESLIVPVVFAVIVGVYFFSYFLFKSLGPHAIRALREPVASLDELDRLAADFKRTKLSRKSYLHDANPQIRYAFIKSLKPKEVKLDEIKELADLVKNESSRIVRRSAALTLAARLASESTYPWFDEALNEIESLQDAPYVIEDICRREREPKFVGLTQRLAVIAELYNAHVSGWSKFLPVRLARSTRLESQVGDDKLLTQAFETGFNDENWPKLYESVPVSAVREAADALSPLNEYGLGTCERLLCIQQIDRMYLFFRRWLFMIDNDFTPRSEVR
jgi:hypothetical protein